VSRIHALVVSTEIEEDARSDELTVEHCKSITVIESLRRKYRHLESLEKTLSDERYKKNAIISRMSRCCSGVATSESIKGEQDRCVSMATELSVAYVECQMKVDKLTETVNRLKLEQIQKSDSHDLETPLRSIIRNKSYQLEQSTTTLMLMESKACHPFFKEF
jgi:predicted RNase H-like nuclease (RuvC/YqgF family)